MKPVCTLILTISLIFIFLALLVNNYHWLSWLKKYLFYHILCMLQFGIQFYHWNMLIYFIIFFITLTANSVFCLDRCSLISTNKHKILLALFNKISEIYGGLLWKNGLNPKPTKARVVYYTIIQLPWWFSGLTHSSSEASI